MSEELFDVVFFGILQTGRDKETVMQNMAKLFKTDAKKLAPYFAGGHKVIKGKINADIAEKYKTALENIGLIIKIEACAITQTEDPAEKAKAPSQTQTNAVTTDTAGISLAPVGADVLKNPVKIPAQKIDDISSISMAEVGANVIENPVEVHAQKINDISDISLSDVGADVLEHPPKVIPQEINDITDFTLAEAGADMIENPKPKEKADIPDTSELSLDEVNDQETSD